MTSIPVPNVKKDSKMKSLVGKKITKKVKFMDEQIEIKKLSVSEVMQIQEAAKGGEGQDEDTQGLDILKVVIRAAVEEASELTDEDFNTFPIDELSKLSDAIMQFSGMTGDQSKGK